MQGWRPRWEDWYRHVLQAEPGFLGRTHYRPMQVSMVKVCHNRSQGILAESVLGSKDMLDWLAWQSWHSGI